MYQTQQPKAIFFDFDGVLCDSEHIHFEAWQRAMAQHGIKKNLLCYEQCYGASDAAIALSMAIHTPQLTANQLIAAKDAAMVELRSKPLPTPDGRDELLTFLKKLVPCIGIVSSASAADIKAILEPQGILPLFDWIIDAYDVSAHKPHPEPYKLAVERSGMAPGDCLAIEDSSAGVTAAHGAGVPVWQITLHYPDPLAHRHFSSMKELQKYVATTFVDTKADATALQ